MSGKTFLAYQLPSNKSRWSLDRSWAFVVGERLLMKAERHLQFSRFSEFLPAWELVNNTEMLFFTDMHVYF